jgi:hypothetical protein
MLRRDSEPLVLLPFSHSEELNSYSLELPTAVSYSPLSCPEKRRERMERPLSEAIVNEARSRSISISEPRDFEAIPGKGVRATVDGKVVLLGNRRLASENGMDPRSGAGTGEA